MTLHPTLLALIAAATLVACGGSSSTNPVADAPVGPPPATTLQASTESLGLKVSGKARQIVVTNTGEHPALGLAVTGREALPAGTQLDSDCDTLAPGMSCTLTVTPGANPSAAFGDKDASGVAMTLTGSNTAPLAVSVHVLDVGSVYQGGYVFDIDDNTPENGSVGGKVLGLEVHIHPWSSASTALQQVGWMVPGARSLTDGKQNTSAIVEHMNGLVPSPDPGTYAAGVCEGSNEGGQTGWYLPAICELGYHALWPENLDAMCGTKAKPRLPANVKSRLIDQGLTIGAPYIYSSTERESPDDMSAWMLHDEKDPQLGYLQYITNGTKVYDERYLCMRTLSP